MSKTIEIISRHTGRMSVSVKGESRSLVFEPKDRDGKTVGVAMVDHDEATVLLKNPALAKDFWKAGQGADDIQAVLDKAAADCQAEKTAELAANAAKGSAEVTASEESPAQDSTESEAVDSDAAAECEETRIFSLVNFNAFKAAVKKCESLDTIKAVLSLEISKEDPNDNRLALLNERMTENQG